MSRDAKKSNQAIRQEDDEVLKEAEPSVGIFWIHDGRLLPPGAVGTSEPARTCEEVQGFKDSRYAHVTAWPEVREHDPGLQHVEYEQVPRGRVIMSGRAFRVFLPPNMADDRSVRREIMRAFNLPSDGTEFIGDEHYQDPADIDWEDWAP